MINKDTNYEIFYECEFPYFDKNVTNKDIHNKLLELKQFISPDSLKRYNVDDFWKDFSLKQYCKNKKTFLEKLKCLNLKIYNDSQFSF